MNELQQSEKGIEYLKVMMCYVFRAQRYLTESHMMEVVKRIEHSYLVRSETVMTLAEIFMGNGRQEGIKEGIIEGKKNANLK